MKLVRRLSAVLLTGTAAAAVITSSAMAAQTAQAVTLPAGMTASYLVIDRTTGATTASLDEHKQYRSASVVKLFIALDYLESHGPGYVIPAADLALLEPMLRSSNDDAASTLWVRDGWEQIVVRMVAKIGLTDTAPPTNRGMWGYTAISAADVAKTYQYILTQANSGYRDFIMSNLLQSTRCGSDGFDQSFGIPSALPRPRAVKQGWSGYGDKPEGALCMEAGLPRGQVKVLDSPEVAAAAAAAPGEGGVSTKAASAIDLTSRAMHTTGVVGDANAQKIVVVLTLEPTTLSWQDSATRITDLTRTVTAAGNAV